jgi:hypothetical protein
MLCVIDVVNFGLFGAIWKKFLFIIWLLSLLIADSGEKAERDDAEA